MSEIRSNNNVINLKNTRKSYTISEKLNALKMLKEFGGNIAKTSRNTNIDRISLDFNKDFKNIKNCV
jgi:hypothetical protein